MNTQSKGMVVAVVLVGILIAVWLMFTGKSDKTVSQPSTEKKQPASGIMPTTNLVFEPASMQIQRTYDQRGKVMLRNDGDKTVNVRVTSDPPDDLNSGFIGRGSEGWFEESQLPMGAGETWAFDFVVHANAIRRRQATIPVKALVQDSLGKWQVAAVGNVDLQIADPPLKLNIKWEEPQTPADQARLVKYLTITNMGEQIPNLTLNFANQLNAYGFPDMQSGPLFGRVWTDPVVERMILEPEKTLRIRVWPRLSPSFVELAGKMFLHGYNKVIEVPYHTMLPDGEQVFVTVSRSTGMAGNSGGRCTNQGAASYAMPPTPGTPGNPPQNDGGMGGGSSGGGSLRGSTMTGSDSTSPEAGDKSKDEDEEDEFVWGNPFGDATGSGSKSNSESNVAQTDKDKEQNTDDESESETSQLADDSLLDNALALIEDLDADALIPPSAVGSDLLPMDEFADTLGRTLDPNWGKDPLKPLEIAPEIWNQLDNIRDPNAATKETVVQGGKDGGVLVAKHNRTENTTALEFRDFGFGIQQGRKLKAGVPLVRNSYPVRQPTLGRTPSGNTVAAYTRPEGDKSVVTVQDVKTGKQIDIGLGKDNAPASSPQIISDPQTGKSYLQYVQDGKVKQSELADDLSLSQPQTLLASNEKVQRILSSQPMNNGKLVTMAKTNTGKVLMKLPDQDAAVELDAKDGSLLTDPDDAINIAMRTKDNAIVVQRSDGQTQQIAPPDPGNGPPTLVRTASGHPRVIFHRKLSDSVAPDAEQGGTFQADFIKGQWFQTKRAVQPEEPVTAAAVSLEFKPKYGKAHFKPMNTELLLNGKTIGKLNARIPDGRYLYQVPTRWLNYLPAFGDQGQMNKISMKIHGIGKGNFAVTDNIAIHTAHSMVQEFLVAPTQNQAQKIAQDSTPLLRHHKPDLKITNNLWELPRSVIPGQKVNAIIGLFNVGDVAVPFGRLVAQADGKVIGQADYALLAPFNKQEIKLTMIMPENGLDTDKPLQVTVSSTVEGDANPKDNSITFTAYADYTAGLTGPWKPSKLDPNKLPESALKTVDISKEPFKFKLSDMSQWYRFKIPDTGKGQLRIALENADPTIVLGVDLYTPEGLPLNLRDDKWQVPGQWIFLRIGLKPDRAIPDNATFTIEWNKTASFETVE
jgi:hypothetical protein